MHLSRLYAKRMLSLVSVALILVSAFAATFRVEPVSAGTYLTLKWTANIGATTNIGALAADLNGDGDLEIVVNGGTNVTALNGTDGSVIWTVNPAGVGTHSPFEIADLNKDDLPEIVVSAGGALALYGNNGSVYWRNDAAGADGHFPVVYDIDGNGYPTVFVSDSTGPSLGYAYITSLSYDGKILNRALGWYPCFGGLSIGDTNLDGRFELYQCDRSTDYYEEADLYKGGGYGLRALDAHTLTPLWNDSDILCSSHCPMLADVDKDGILDVIAVDQTPHNGSVVLNSADGSVVTTGGKYRKGSIGSPGHSQPTIYDLDEDGNLEMITCSSSNPVIWDLYQWKLDATLPRAAGEPPKVGDVTGDGKMDIILSSGGSIYIYSYNSTSGQYDEVDSVGGLTGANAYTLVQDVDGDDYNELIVTSTSETGPVYCFDTPAPTPTPKPRTNFQFYSERKCGVAEYVAPLVPSSPALLFDEPENDSTIQPLNPTLSVRAADFQGDLMNVTFETNTTGTWESIASYTNVGNGVYNATPSSMNEYDTTYYWGVYATDGANSTWKTYRFTTYQPASWWDNRWLYRKPIVIDKEKVAGDLTNFPVLVDITDSNLASKAEDDGSDIAFTDYDGDKLDHEIESFNRTSGKLVAWVRIPSLSSATDTIAYLYYGSGLSGGENATAVWDSDFLAVHHLDESSGTAYDSTANHNDGTPFGGLNQDVAGKINGADYFDAVDDYLRLPQVFTSETEFTLEAWFYSDGTLSLPQYIVSQWSETTVNATLIDKGAQMNVFQNSSMQLIVNENRSGTPVSLGTWYYAVGTFNGSIGRIFLNGFASASFGANLTWPTENMFIGDRSDHQRKFHGLIDEVRFSKISRSTEWIQTSYRNQYDPASFYRTLEEEAVPTPPEAPVVQPMSPIDNAIAVPLSLSQLSFKLTDYQSDPMNYTVTTAPNIGSGNAVNVGNGTYIVTVSGLQYSTTYYWNVNVTDGTCWTNETFKFTTRNPPEHWWDDRWLYRKPLVIDRGMVAANLTSFPVLIDVTDTDLASKAQDDGDDIAFADYYGYKLDHEIEFFNGTNGKLVAWVRIPELSSGVDTTIYMYYGSPLSAQQDASAVWDSGFLAVHHLDETSGTAYDSTSNRNDGTPAGDMNQNAAGHIDGADYFDGVNDDVELPQVFTAETGFAVEAWFYAETGSEQNAGYITSQFGGNPSSIGTMINLYNNSNIQFFVNNYSMSTAAISLNTWYYVVGTFDGSTARLYINGVAVGSVGASVTWPSNYTYIGDRADRTRHWKGMLDEIRISNMSRSNEWILTCYNNQYNPSGFYALGEEEKTGQLATAPIIHDASPQNGQTDVSIYLSELSFSLTDYQSDLMSYTLATTSYIGSGSGTSVGDGTYVVTVQYLAYSTTYTWHVSVTDGTHVTNETYQFTTGPRPQYWWNSSWTYRKPITVDHNKISANLTSFPVLIDVTDTDLASKAQDDGDDIAFADYYGYKLDHEIEFFNGTNGKLVAWVKIPSLSSVTDTTIYMYYDNPTASNQQNASGVWDADFLAVHHLEETSGTCYDSTINDKDGTPYGSPNQDVTGRMDGADYFDGVDDQIRLVKVFSAETQFTMEAWIYAVTGARYFLTQWNNNNGVFMQVGAGGNTSIEWYINGASAGSGSIPPNTWNYVVGTYNGTHAMLYLNGGVPATKASAAPNWPSENTYISGRSADLLRQFKGNIDEARFSNISRSIDWIKTCYKNQYSPSSFYTVGNEQAGPPSETVMFVSPSNREALLNNDYAMYVEVAYVENLYAWELQLNYNQTMLDITSVSVVSGGLNDPTQTYHNLTDETSGHLWWAVSTVHPTTTGISYDRHAVLEIHFRTTAAGTSNIELFGTNLSDNSTNPIVHTVANATIAVTGTIDLTVTNISILNHACSIYANDTHANGSPYYYPVEVTIENTGTVNAGSFYVKLEVYWVNGSITEASQELFEASLAGGTSVTLNYTSLFHPAHTGIYRLIATVDSRDNVTESTEANNALTQENVTATIIGDLNNDGTTNILDGVVIALAWNATPTDGHWNIRADINHDDVIDILDGARIGLHWGEKR